MILFALLRVWKKLKFSMIDKWSCMMHSSSIWCTLKIIKNVSQIIIIHMSKVMCLMYL